MQYASDFIAANVASGAILPIMSTIDMAIIRSQYGTISLKEAFKSQPRAFWADKSKSFAAFGIMFKTYKFTYLTANLTETFCKQQGIDHKLPTLAATSLVNMIAIAYKDNMYARMFQQSSIPPERLPTKYFISCAMRDGLTVSAAFVLKDTFRSYLESTCNFPHTQADLIASFTLPVSAQLFSTPIHIYALDILNRPEATLGDRWHLIQSKYSSICTGRILRIIPAFGIGGFLNDMVKETLRRSQI